MEDIEFRQAMGKFSTGITIITTEDDGKPHGMTANAFMSVSMDPKLVAISVDHKTNMYEKMINAKKYAVSILETSQEDISRLFAKQMAGKENFHFSTFHNLPVIPGALVHLACDVVQEVKAGDHTIFIGEVKDLAMEHQEEKEPLLYYRGHYNALRR
ncbi:flavin reductase family protein [Natribacillus halophilus]|uniref:NADH-FMN oxidoreductase RutF, flavin reductase (DIM6/NTAB) family n=1 Tax=Natribacillus halophilus TaxID=549003 RepID=A0A1G8Q5U1_9BACI|nr:flavin reductase family protein [Natribacillus halophilus]SDI99450.1 NADH-FMN oxidoreductase RutF, flavin reductase (DIM6/NTAB) family [Natribacillus halophilus]